MKKRYLLPVLFLAATTAFGQASKTAKADKYYQAYNYTAAAKAYEKVLQAEPDNLSAMVKLVQSYQKLKASDKANIWLDKALLTPSANAKNYRELAALFAAGARYQEATLLYRKAVNANDKESVKWLEAYQNLDAFYEDSLLYTSSRTNFNSAFSDFSPAFFGKGIVFSSSRSNVTKANRQDQNYSGFIDLFYAETGADATTFDQNINSKYHEGPLTFNVTQDTVYFTRSTVQKKSVTRKAGVNNLNIYVAVLQGGKWQHIQAMPFNSNNYSVGHPALEGNNTIYFVSDMPGGYGGTDLYKVERVGGKWQTPVNLGSEINTVGNEMFPFVASEGTLYFASNGHPGLGGLDLFAATKQAGKFGEVKSLGYPLNTSGDDFGLIIKDNAGYYSSNYRSGYDDIFNLKINHEKQVYVVAIDDTGKLLTDVQLEASAAGTTVNKSNLTYALAKFNWAYGSFDKLAFSKKGYAPTDIRLSKADFFKYNTGDTIRAVLTKKIAPIGDRHILVALQDMDGNNLPGGKLDVTELKTGTRKNYALNEQGIASVVFSAGKDYLVTGSKQGFNDRAITFSAKVVSALDPDEELSVRLKARELFNTMKIGETIELEIEYDLAKATIRPSAALILDKLVSYMQKYPDVKVELGAHTDSRGSHVYNQDLSQRRADSAAAYLASKGIDARRMVSIGYGENKLKVVNAKNEVQHQRNRRTTVKILSRNEEDLSAASVTGDYLISSRTNRYYIIIGGFTDLAAAELKFQEIARQESSSKIIPPFAKHKIFRISVADFSRKEDAQKKVAQLKATYGADIWVLNY